MSDSFDQLIQEQMREAKAMGIVPVFAMLSPEVPQARAIYEDVKGRVLEMPPDKQGMAVLLPLPPADAARLFRRHAGKAGSVAADMLEDKIPADYWLAVFTPQTLSLLAFRDGKEVHRASMRYDKVSRHVRSLTKLLNDPDVSLLTVQSNDGQKMTVCGATGGATALATALAGIALTRQLPATHEGRIVSVPIDEDQLASFLLNAFNDPKIVAEAIMALKKLGDGKERWLKTVLGGRPELRELANQVERELTGA